MHTFALLSVVVFECDYKKSNGHKEFDFTIEDVISAKWIIHNEDATCKINDIIYHLHINNILLDGDGWQFGFRTKVFFLSEDQCNYVKLKLQ